MPGDLRSAVLASVLVLCVPAAARAEQRFALIVAGASGGPSYVEQYRRWSEALTAVLVERMRFDPAAIARLGDEGVAEKPATAQNVRGAIDAIRRAMSRDDLLFVVLIGHGTFDGVDAKFNLEGPDMESAEWAAALRGVPGRLVIVNTTAASFPFIERLSGPRRIVITATDSAAQRFDTVFPEYFIKALEDESADIDKNGRTSIWEAFAAATTGVRRHYQQHGQLATERALLDDNGDGVGREAADEGEEGSVASRTYLDQALPGAAPTDEVMLKLLQRRTALETEVEELKIRRSFLPPEEYAREFERVMIELARVSREIRRRGAQEKGEEEKGEQEKGEGRREKGETSRDRCSSVPPRRRSTGMKQLGPGSHSFIHLPPFSCYSCSPFSCKPGQ